MHDGSDVREPEYDNAAIRFLEMLWGEGFLSPGGPQEVAVILTDIDLTGKRVLDIGCGSGGIACHLVKTHGAAHVTGYDVERPVIDAARDRAREQGLTERIAFVHAAPGPLPFSNEAFDLVFSKDAIVHVPDKAAMISEIWRVLKPGGAFAASDWMIGHDDPPSPQMLAYLEAEGLSFNMASPSRYQQLLRECGFVDVSTRDRNEWYLRLARTELERLRGDLGDSIAREIGRAYVDKNIETWRAMLPVLESGEHRPTHLRAVKPALPIGKGSGSA